MAINAGNTEKNNSDQSAILVIGYSDAGMIRKQIEDFASECESRSIFIDAKIEPPTALMVETVTALLPTENILHPSAAVTAKVIDSIFDSLPANRKAALSVAVTETFSELDGNKIGSQLIKNAFIRTVWSLHSMFAGLLSKSDHDLRFFFDGQVNKYDIITLQILCKMNVSFLVIGLQGKIPEFFLHPQFTVADGQNKNKVAYTLKYKQPTPPEISRNSQGLQVIGDDFPAYVDSLLREQGGEYASGTHGINVLSLCFSGYSAGYEANVNRLYLSLKAKRPVCVIDDSFPNPTVEEVRRWDEMNRDHKTTEQILERYPPFAETSVPAYVRYALDMLLKERNFTSESQKMNFIRVLHIWLIRICDTFYKSNLNINRLPVILIWKSVPKRVNELLRCLENFPVDLVQLIPEKGMGYSPQTQINIDIGAEKQGIEGFPYEIADFSQHETVAYQAEQEIQKTLSDGALYFQMKQFKSLNTVVLKTTYEELDIIWNEPAKFRPGFATAGDIVTIPSIFAKVNGVKDDVKSYMSDIQKKITPDTLLISRFPYIAGGASGEARDFIKQVYFKDGLNIEKVKSSPYYRYGIFSTETQNVLLRGISAFIKSDVYIKKNPSFVYDELELLLRLPQNIVQLIHDFSFTESIPKLIVFNASDIACSAEDCVIIAFLKLMGFDIIIFAPTGYRVVEEHIREDMLNEINIGPYHYNLANEAGKLPNRKKSIFDRLFG